MNDNLWENFSRRVNIPESEVKRIKSMCSSDKECKEAATDYLISSHPAPSWRLVARALYLMVPVHGQSCLQTLTRLQQLFPIGI